METTTKKQAIVQSIDSMNEAEMEKVIGFIRGLIYSPDLDQDYLEFKRKGLKEIQDALSSAERAV
ncbi:MAG: hypothetical protein RLO81_18890 [Fulvivirga sp.]|uniref:hypothetical protein n=1 Tax=Fulvivirga sp. TaxID=1931237 RepID=UPI0032EECEEA